MALKKAFIRKLAAKLRRLRHEEHYDQGTYLQKTECGTAACIAGHAALLAGWRTQPCSWSPKTDFALAIKKGSKTGDVAEVAAAAMGLSPYSWVFDGDPAHLWPGQWRERWEKALRGKSKERFSRIAADLLDALADGRVKP